MDLPSRFNARPLSADPGFRSTNSPATVRSVWWLHRATGFFHTEKIDGLPAPNDLEPRRLTRTLHWSPPRNATLDRPVKITVELDPEDHHYEITESNNRAVQFFPRELEAYRVPRMWKTLARKYGLQPGDPFPTDFPRDQIR